MTDVMHTTSLPDRAQAWRTALERAVKHTNFGREIVRGTFTEKASSICLNGEGWEITSDFDIIICAEVAFPMPQINAENTDMLHAILDEDTATNSGIFAKCWNGSPAAQACADELRKALGEEINFFVECAAQERITKKLIA